jgi:hypothetical protein
MALRTRAGFLEINVKFLGLHLFNDIFLPPQNQTQKAKRGKEEDQGFRAKITKSFGFLYPGVNRTKNFLR